MKKRLLSIAALVLALSFGLSACASHSKTFYFGNYSEAEKFYNKGEYEKAIEHYQAHIDEAPEGNLAVISRYYMAKSYQALGKNEEARHHYKIIVDRYPELVWANFSREQLQVIAQQS